MDIGRYKIASQEEHYREITDKALRLAWYTGLMFGLGATVVGFIDKPPQELLLSFGLQFFPLLIAGFATTRVARPTTWRNFPEMKDLKQYWKEEADYTCQCIGLSYGQIIEKNRLILSQKTKWLKVTLWVTAVQMVLLGFVVFLSIFSRW